MRHPGPVDPAQPVTDLEPGQADRQPHEIVGSRPGECRQVPSGLEYAQALVPQRRWRDERIPVGTHESSPLGHVLAVAGDPRANRMVHTFELEEVGDHHSDVRFTTDRQFRQHRP